MDATERNVKKAMVQYARGERPSNFKKPKSWYIIGQKGKVYPLKAIYAMATRAGLNTFNTKEARNVLQALGFEIGKFDDQGDSFEKSVSQSLSMGKKRRRARLKTAHRKPTQRVVQTVVYDRNPDVIAEVLDRAQGRCEVCNKDAPFLRPNGDPYLEVHHTVRLADDGDDTIENAVALCPNCHREKHFGQQRFARQKWRQTGWTRQSARRSQD